MRGRVYPDARRVPSPVPISADHAQVENSYTNQDLNSHFLRVAQVRLLCRTIFRLSCENFQNLTRGLITGNIRGMNTIPISLDERRALRRKNLPDALTSEQLRRTAVTRMRWSLTQLIEDNADSVQGWIEDVVWTDGPKAALEIYIKLLEFAVPKLSRAEVSVEDGGKTRTAQLTMEQLQEIIREAQTLDGTATQVKED